MSLQSRDYLDSPSFVERLDLPRRGVAGRERDVQRGPVKAEQRRPGGSGRTAQPNPAQPSPAPRSPSKPQAGPSLALEAHRGGGSGGGRVCVRHGHGPRASGTTSGK